MKKLILILLVVFTFGQVNAKSLLEPESKSKVNIGFKGGFASTGLFMSDIVLQGHSIKDYEINSQVGYFFSIVARMNKKRFYLQTELSPIYLKSAISFDKNSWDSSSNEVSNATFSMEGYFFEIPLFIGYNIIDEEPYSMSVYTGPKINIPFTSQYKTSFTDFNETGLVETPISHSFCWTAGVGYKIGRAFFNFEYSLGLNNISKDITFDINNSNKTNNVTLDRKIGVFSFALGVLF